MKFSFWGKSVARAPRRLRRPQPAPARQDLFEELYLECLEDRWVLNAAPVLDNMLALSLTSINEGTASPSGNVISAILATGGDPITDTDNNPKEGIAVTGVDNTNGTWEYSTNGGGVWTAFGAVSDTSATLLKDNALLRFAGATDNGTHAITFRAWDQTSGNNGDTGVDVSTNGTTTAFSTDTTTASITVNNVAPTVSNVAPNVSSLNENGSITFGGTVGDAGSLDTLTVVISWGDGSTDTTLNLAAGVTSFSTSHQYLDDAPTNTSSDVQSIGVTVTDDDGGSTSTTSSVTVNNVAPSALSLTPTPGTVNENNSLSLAGSFADPGTLDTHTVVIDWGDGSSNTTLNLAAGVLTFNSTHTYLDDNPTGTAGDSNTISVTVTDDDLGSLTGTTSATINNVAPSGVMLTPTPSTQNENGSVSLAGSFTDPGTLDTHTVVIDWGDGSSNTTLNLAAGVLTFSSSHTYLDDSPTGTASDIYTIAVTVTDDDLGSAMASSTVTVNNVAPSSIVLTPTPATQNENGSVSLAGSFTDPGSLDTHTVVIAWGDGSANTTLNLAANVTTFSSSHTYLDDDPTATSSDSYTISVTVTDDDLGSASNTTSVTVNNVAPSSLTLTPTPSTLDENNSISLAGSFTDPGTLDTHTVVIDWGDGSSNTTLNLAANVTSFSSTHLYQDDDPTATSSDSYTISVTVTDDDLGSTTNTSSVTVNNVAPSAITLTPTPAALNENDTVGLLGTFTDPGLSDTHTVVITWGDGSANTTLNLAAGVTTFNTTHQYLDDDPTATASDSYTISVTVTDDDLGSATNTTGVTVTNVAPSAVTVSVTPGALDENDSTALSGSFVDVGTLDTHTVVINWGDGGSNTTLNLAAGVTSFSTTHQYLDDNPTSTASDVNTITVTVTDDDLGSASGTTTTTISNVVPSALVLTPTPATLNENGSTSLAGSFTDPGTLDTHTVVINWGDGGSNTTLNLAAGVTTFSTTHQYLDDSPTGTSSDSYSISVTVSDDDLGSIAATTSVTVNNVAPSAVTLTPSPSTQNENSSLSLAGSFTDPGTLDTHVVVIDWGDGGATTTLNLGAGVTTFNSAHVYQDDDPTATAADSYTISVTVTDDDLGSASGTTNVTISNVAPSAITLTPTPSTLNENDTVSLAGSFTDPGTLDTHIVVINWGDGGATTTLNLAAGITTFNTTHQYLDDDPTATASDSYTISVTVTDDDLGSGTGTTSVTLNNVAPSSITLSAVPTVINENDSVNLTGSFTDPGTLDTHTVVINWGDGSANTTLNLAAGVLGFSSTHQYLDDNPTATASDLNTITVTVTDDDLGSAANTTAVTVFNLAPTGLTVNLGVASLNEADSTTLTGSFADVGTQDSHVVVIAWGDGSSNTTLNLAAGVTTFNVSHQFLDDNPTGTSSDLTNVVVTLTDDDGGSLVAGAAITVQNVAPSSLTLAATPSTLNENNSLTLTGSFTDPGTLDTHTVVIDWGDGSGLTTLNLAAGVTTFTPTHQYLDDDPTGTASDVYSISVTVTDDDLGTTANSTNVTVNNVAPSGVTLTPTPASGNENGSVNLAVGFTDPGTLDTHTVVIDWGDGSGLTTVNLAAGVTTANTSHVYLDDNPTGTASDVYSISVTVSDDDLASASASTNVTINNVAPSGVTLSAVPGTLNENDVTSLSGSFTDPGTLDTFSVVINWGDGSANTTLNLAAGVTTFSANHQYLDDNPTATASDVNTISVTVTDDDGGVGSSSTAVTVNNVAPSGLSISVGSGFLIEGDVNTLSGSYVDPGTQDTHSVVINWGDGSANTTLNLAAGVTTFNTTHTYTDDNPSGTSFDVNSITVTVNDDDGGSTALSSTVTVLNLSPTLVTLTATPSALNENASTTLAGTIADVGTLDTHTIVIDWGDGGSLTTLNLAAGVTAFSSNHQYLDDDPTSTASDVYSITVQVTDDDLGSTSGGVSVQVNNVAPSSVTITPASATINENASTSFSGSFVDPGTLDTHTVIIDWGDGSANSTLSLAAGVTTFSTTHQYLDDDPSGTSADVYAITATVLDDDLGAGSGGTMVTVNNVPPSGVTVSATPSTLNEGNATSLAGSFLDPGTLDAHTVIISWGDGSANSVLLLGASVTNFSALHSYLDDNPSGTASDNYTINVVVLDDDLGSASGSTTVTVNNVAPSALSLTLGPAVLNEGDTASLSGSFSDPGVGDTHTVVINWGDGGPNTTLNLAANVTNFNATHVYVDDNPTATATDNYTVTVTVGDDDLGSTSRTTPVTVNNVAPVLSNVTLTPFALFENDVATLSGKVSDPGALDTFVLSINWGDGGAVQQVNLAAGTTIFSVTHTYLDDNPTGTTFDLNTVQLSIQDDDTGASASVPQSIFVLDVAPQLRNLSATTINENGTTTLTGTVVDPGTLDTFALSVDWGDGSAVQLVNLPAGTTSFSLTHQYLDDDPSGTSADSYKIVLAIVDDDRLGSNASTLVTVNNVAPSAVVLTASPSPISEGNSTTVNGSFVDPGTLDTHTVVVDWGDGTNSVLLLGAGTFTFNAAHTYLDDNPSATPSDIYTIVARVFDDDLGVGQGSANVRVNNVAPSNLSLALSTNPADEGSPTKLAIRFQDVGIQDTHRVVVNWGDGSPSSAVLLGPGVLGTVVLHTYRDDNPTATPSDLNTIQVVVTDDDTGTLAGSITERINNVPPGLVQLAASAITADARTTLTGIITDVGTRDTFTVVVQWGDGTLQTFFRPVPGPFAFSHQYAGGNPNSLNPAAPISINVHVVDDDTGEVDGQAIAEVLGTGLTIAYIDTTPAVPKLPVQTVVTGATDDVVRHAAPIERHQDETRSTFAESRRAENVRVSLWLVLNSGAEQIKRMLSLDVLDDLRSFFHLLPDGHYRVYVEQDGAKRLVLDVHLRQGRVVSPDIFEVSQHDSLPVL